MESLWRTAQPSLLKQRGVGTTDLRSKQLTPKHHGGFKEHGGFEEQGGFEEHAASKEHGRAEESVAVENQLPRGTIGREVPTERYQPVAEGCQPAAEK